MDVLREREVKDSLERQLLDEQKIRGRYLSIQRLENILLHCSTVRIVFNATHCFNIIMKCFSSGHDEGFNCGRINKCFA